MHECDSPGYCCGEVLRLWIFPYGFRVHQSVDTSLPSLTIPLFPRLSLSDRVLLCYFCYRIGPDNRWVRIGRREVQTRFCRPGGRRVSKRIKGLYRAGILTRREPRAAARAYDYRLSTDFSRTPESERWRALSDVLFGEHHPWRTLFDRPVVGHGFLNASGVLVLGAIVAVWSGVSTGELQKYFRGFLGEQTVRNAVHRLEAMASVRRNDEGLLVPTDDWLVRLDDYEEAVGANKRAKRVRDEIQFERDSYLGGEC